MEVAGRNYFNALNIPDAPRAWHDSKASNLCLRSDFESGIQWVALSEESPLIGS